MRLLPMFLARWLGRLRYPQLFTLVGALLLVDLVAPDPIPFLDEILLGSATLLLSQLKTGEWRKSRAADEPPVREKNVTPGERL